MTMAAVDVTEERAAELLGAARRVLLGIHRNPDGDAVGSALGLAHVLRGRGAEAVCLFAEGVPEPFRFLAGADRTVDRLPDGPPFDLAVALDCGDASVLPRSWPDATHYRGLLVLDHHPVRRPFGDWTLRDATACCVGEIVLRLADRLGHVLDRPLAEAVYVSLATDTGFFRYSSVTPAAFRLAARLLEAGVAPWKIAFLVDENYPAARLEMLSGILGTLRLTAGGAVATLTVPPGLLERLGLGNEYLEGVINFARGIRGVEVSAQLRVNEEGKIRVSLRSRGRVDVAALARAHGGGGHRNASGCTLDPPLEAARERIESAAAAAVAALPPLAPGDESFYEG
ncbi:MAG: bifunctional oligoribonuclease/PAP phosphatase NrnA [Myxococcales bacterium]|nr:bifunctional oligoribonuclease/PAP phosphatase NrnA [Myxococcales bacterium]